MIPFDRKMRGICRRTNLCYTRYADDIVVSGERANSIFPFLAENLEHMEMQLNAKKTRVLRPHRAMNVTGVTINSGIPTVSKKFRRRLRAAIHNTQLFVEGAFSPLAKEPEPEKIQRLLGWAGWCASVNPKHASLLEKAKEVRRVWDTSG
jgi:RNA-directed DNA polymerase